MQSLIAKAREDQYQAVRGFYHALTDAYDALGTSYIGWQKDIYPSPEFLSDSIRKGELYLTFAGEEIAGAMVLNHECNEGYRNYPWQTEASEEEVLLIHALGVHPDHARRGYARAMVLKALALAEEAGMKAVRLDVLCGNTPAERLYEGLGFQCAATVSLYYEDTGLTDFKLYEYQIR